MNTQVFTILDVRSPMEFAGGHVPGSINIPLDLIPQRMDDIRAIEGPIVVCCASGMRSMSACEYLYRMGVTNISDGGSWYSVAEFAV